MFKSPPGQSQAEEDACFNRILDVMAGTAVDLPDTPLSGPVPAVALVLRIERALEQLEQRVRALEAELEPTTRMRKCPRCCRPSLNVTARRPHPEFAEQGIEQHEIRCDQCGYHAERLHDPSGLIC